MRYLVLTALVLAALLWPPATAPSAAAAEAPRLFASLVRFGGPVTYPNQRVTLTVQVATDADRSLPVFAFLSMGDGLVQAARQSDSDARRCKNDFFQEFDCAFNVDAAHPKVIAFDAFTRPDQAPGVITATLEVWPIETGRSALITETLTLDVIAPYLVQLPVVAR